MFTTSLNRVGCSTGRSAGFSPLRDLVDEDCGATVQADKARAVGDQAAGLGIFGIVIDRRHLVPCKQAATTGSRCAKIDKARSSTATPLVRAAASSKAASKSEGRVTSRE